MSHFIYVCFSTYLFVHYVPNVNNNSKTAATTIQVVVGKTTDNISNATHNVSKQTEHVSKQCFTTDNVSKTTATTTQVVANYSSSCHSHAPWIYGQVFSDRHKQATIQLMSIYICVYKQLYT